MTSKKVVIGLVFIFVIIGGLSTGGFMYIYSQTKAFDQVFMDGIFVEDIHLGGLTKQEAKERVLEVAAKKDEGKTIVITGNEKELTIPAEKFEAEYNVEEVLDEAFKIGHEGNIFEKYKAANNKDKKQVKFELTHSYNKEAAAEVIKEYAQEIEITPQDATMVRENKQFIITPEKPGMMLDIESTVEKINKVYETEGGGTIEAVIVEVAPKRTASYFDNVQTPISSFYTSYNNADQNRNVNLKVGSKAISTILEPDEVFALSDYLEPITAQAGYKSSKVIVNGKLVDGIGGGICQVASTLYNSVLLTGLEIVSRQNHSLPVGYIPLGRDATYASNAIDFKFKNPSEYPVYIDAFCENNRVYVDIFGHANLKPDHEIKFESVVTQVVPAPEPQEVDDPTLAKGQRVQELAPLDGKKVTLYKYTYKNGQLLDKVVENNSYYRPRAGIFRVGTKEEDSTVEVPETKDPGEGEKIPEVPVELETPDVIDDSSQMNLYEEQV